MSLVDKLLGTGELYESDMQPNDKQQVVSSMMIISTTVTHKRLI